MSDRELIEVDNEADLKKLKVGDSFKYYVGNLSIDREKDQRLSEFTYEIFARSTTWLLEADPQKPDNKDGVRFQEIVPEGKGEFELYQKPEKVKEITYNEKTGDKVVRSYLTGKTEYWGRRVK